MLSRVADALFWMSRYLERTEHTARLLDVSFHQQLDLSGLSGDGEEIDDVLDVLQTVPAEGSPSPNYWLTFDSANLNSIMSCVNRAQNNARSIRGAISQSVWRELNKLYWKVRDPEFASRALDSPHDFYGAIEEGSHLFQGVCNATMMNDEGLQFVRLGRYLERAEKTLRLLDVKTQRLVEAEDVPMVHYRWAGVLKSCLAYEAYQRLYISRVEPARVVEFLLLHAEFPRSVRFCLENAAQALENLGGRPTARGEARADWILGKMISELRFLDFDTLPQESLPAYLQKLLGSCWETGATIQQQYALG